jgi:solute carrier family 25 folate transporter 32
MINNEFTISTISSIFASTLTHPIDVIKTNYQVLNYQKYKPNTINIIKNIYKTNSYKGFYKGFSSTLITYPLFWGIFFQTKDYTNVMVSSSFASLITNPLFVIKTRFQTNPDIKYKSLIRNIYYSEGIYGFYKGFMLTVINNTRLWIQFPLYDEIKLRFDNTNTISAPMSITMSSLLSKIISSTIYYPTDLIRTNQRNMQNNMNMMEVAKNMYKINGIRGFYNGSLLYNMISVPNFIILMIMREYLKNNFDK